MWAARSFTPWLGACCFVGGGYALQKDVAWAHGKPGGQSTPGLSSHVPTRAQQLSKLRDSSREKPFDLLIVGGGATGTGCAVDAATRGLRTALVEREDFASGTSSKSTKLVHGGVRYLEKAVFQVDPAQLKLVYEALQERRAFLDNAPHLSRPLPIITPCYKWWEIPYYWIGLKAYDLVSWSQHLVLSRFMAASEAVELIPTLATERDDGRTLKGAVLYYDGQFDDARMNVALACTASAAGAVVTNYTEVQQLIKNEEGKIIGAIVKDSISGQQLEVYAKVVINATGPFADSLRRLSQPGAKAAVVGSAGTHVVLPLWYGSQSAGLIIPKTKDGRVLFVLPFQDHIVAGTTDAPTAINTRPQPSEEEVAFILDSMAEYLGIKVRRSDVLSTWTGIRPLASNPNSKPGATENIVRDHVIFTDEDGMVTVTGGKWTTYRRMAEDALEAALATGRLPMNPKPCATHDLKLWGAQHFHHALHAEIAQAFSHGASPAAAATSAAAGSASSSSSSAAKAAGGGSKGSSVLSVDAHTAWHLAHAYGDQAYSVLQLAQDRGLGGHLVEGHPYLEAEVVHCAQHEYCERVEDFISRRTRLAFLDAAAAAAAVPRVAALMAETLGWDAQRRQAEERSALQFLAQCFCAGAGGPAVAATKDVAGAQAAAAAAGSG